ncbi:hypothetical protein ABL78_1445 [Leptomonas seymouri]|uniref:MORN repeat-containing protein 5 n=1 Tax=Leptomonas seymouri TaxID=5684 RepID=A0A0N0P808_LEPSE|nr:hypothetical protein ABL78_1445 [Leptomonas seymouri]|eukprot:KPI89409.1 hypothetical protein ABL78_1445 [Leptomonas seymouri]
MDFIPCSYIGQCTADGRRFDGLGRFTFTNGDVYVGGMQDGQFHGQGVIFFRGIASTSKDSSAVGRSRATTSPSVSADHPGSNESAGEELRAFLNPTESASFTSNDSWRGQYRGVWEYGRHIEGKYVFQDGLVHGNEMTDPKEFSSSAWTYCHGSDRRLWEEYLENVAPVLPHEALLGGARLLRERKRAVATAKVEGSDAAHASEETEGEGLPLVLPNAFVQARKAPAFAAGQLLSVNDPRVTRWTAAAVAEEAAKKQKTATSFGNGQSGASSSEMIESTIELQLAVSLSTKGSHAPDNLNGDEAVNDMQVVGEPQNAAPAKLNLSVCRVKDVEDVSRALLLVVPAPP